MNKPVNQTDLVLGAKSKMVVHTPQTDCIIYRDGIYVRRGDKIIVSRRSKILPGIPALIATEECLKDFWVNLNIRMGYRDGWSYRVEGWVNESARPSN